jgi:perosamine synthetase
MFQSKVPRGRLYHSLVDSFIYLLRCAFCDLNDASRVEKFEQVFAGYCGSKYAIAFPKARVALWFYLRMLDLPRGSKVLMPPITIKGMLDVVVDLGLEPIYADLDLNNAFPSLCDLQDIVSQHMPKVCLLTPLFGVSPAIMHLVSFLSSNHIKVIVDFSHCLNCCDSSHAISMLGDISIYSSSSIKTLDTLGGGLALTSSHSTYLTLKESQESLRKTSRFQLIRKALINFCRNLLTSRAVFSHFTYPMIQYLSTRFPTYMLRQTGTRSKLRFNHRLPTQWFDKFSSVQAQIGLQQILRVARQDDQRIHNATQIINLTKPDYFLRSSTNNKSVYWQLLYFVDSPIHAKLFFADRNIDVAATSLSLISSFDGYPNSSDLPNAERIYYQSIFIPCFSSLTDQDIAALVDSVNAYNSLRESEDLQ